MKEFSTCADCYFSNRQAHPGAVPEGTMGYFLGIFPIMVRPSNQVMDAYYLRKYLFENTLVCQRYPRPEVVHKGYGCGEFADRYEVNKGVVNEKQKVG